MENYKKAWEAFKAELTNITEGLEQLDAALNMQNPITACMRATLDLVEGLEAENNINS